MTANEVIIKALKPLGYPCEPDSYTGMEKKYFTFNCADERGGDFGDNEPGCILKSMQIHFFMPLNEKRNPLAEKRQAREALFAAGFTYPVVTELTEPENNIRHIVYECDITEEREEN